MIEATGRMSLKDAELTAIRQALRHFTGNKSKAADTLGISRKHLYTRMRALGMDEEIDGESDERP